MCEIEKERARAKRLEKLRAYGGSYSPYSRAVVTDVAIDEVIDQAERLKDLEMRFDALVRLTGINSGQARGR